MRLTQAARIDAFVLNMARNEETNGALLDEAFEAARVTGFKLSFHSIMPEMACGSSRRSLTWSINIPAIVPTLKEVSNHWWVHLKGLSDTVVGLWLRPKAVVILSLNGRLKMPGRPWAMVLLMICYLGRCKLQFPPKISNLSLFQISDHAQMLCYDSLSRHRTY